MDKTRALEVYAQVQGKTVEGFLICSFINWGKSAIVVKGKNQEGKNVAIKLFDRELVDRFGHEVQQKRIEQEIDLKGHTIEGLVAILSGGQTTINSAISFYLIMELIDGMNLRDFIQSQKYDHTFMLSAIKSLVLTTEALLSKKGIVHRDIKPENIMVTNQGKILLMDLGVLKLVGIKSFSDIEEKQFLGTLRYAPPEFLTREEEDSSNGWRAINLYQIGAVLYELIEKKELFADESPYPRLVLAIKEKNPRISPGMLPTGTLQLTRNLLVKNWRIRLEINPVSHILQYCEQSGTTLTELDNMIEVMQSTNMNYVQQIDEILAIRSSNEERLKRKNKALESILKTVDHSLDYLVTKGVINHHTNFKPFFHGHDINGNPITSPRYNIYRITGYVQQGFPRPLYLVLKIENDEYSFTRISFANIFVSKDLKINPGQGREFLQTVNLDLLPEVKSSTSAIGFDLCEIWKGVFESNDVGTRDELCIKLAQSINKSLTMVTSEVERELHIQKTIQESGNKKLAFFKDKSVTYLMNNLT